MQKITDRQRMVLDFIRASIAERGYPPTLREIARHMGIKSTNGVNDHIRALERKGMLVREDMKSRALRPTTMPDPSQPNALLPSDGSILEIPIVSRVVSGRPILSDEFHIDTVRVERLMLKHAFNVFGLRVQGGAMADAGIVEGDYLFLSQQLTAQDGEVAAVMVGDEAIVRYHFRTPDHVRLQPAAKDMAPIYIRTRDFRPAMILGVAVGVFRRV